MDNNASIVITDYLKTHDDLFTVEEFCHYLKENGVKLSKADATELLRSSNYVFPLVKNEYITRAGVFTGRWFSFKPSKEEIEKDRILLGHRCIPFVNPEISPDNIEVMSVEKVIDSVPQSFSMNLAMDTYALFGEGYIIPYIFNDKANTTVPLTAVQYSLPSEITLTSWPLSEITNGAEFEYGDRLLCRVIDWENSLVEMSVLKAKEKGLTISEATFQREEWYSIFENGLLVSFDRHGPAESIEEQLSFLFLENQEQLCIRNCGSIEEFLAHTTKIGFEPYGVESRIWRKGESVPLTGDWNAQIPSTEIILSEMALNFTPQVIDAYLEDNLYCCSKGKMKKDPDQMLKDMFPQMVKLDAAERKIVLLNIEKRNDILEKNYNRFSDYTIADIRSRILALFTQVNNLFCGIGCSGLKVDEFPQQELVVLSQLYAHLVRLLEEVENVFLRDQFPQEDVALSLDGMEDTFDDIRGSLQSALDNNLYKGYGIVK